MSREATITPRELLRRSRDTALHTLRRASSTARALPDFVVIGAQKSGTTALYTLLSQHPALLPAALKEVHYFDLNFERGVEWYRSHFPTRVRLERRAERLGVRAITGEASPYYLFHPDVPRRMHALLPNARLIVLLRDPVRRAISHHNHEVQDGFETLSFSEAIEAEPRRLAPFSEKSAIDRQAAAFSHLHHSYLARGRYAEQLERWFAVYPRERFLIIESGEFFDDPACAVSQVVAFLGLPPHRLDNYRNETSRHPSDVDPDTQRRLYTYFAPHNERLYRLLGSDLGWERRSP
jgi:Sulfotransferase domain